MKTYKTKTMEVEELIWEPEYNYSKYIDKEVKYTYDSTGYLRILIGILCFLFTIASVFICFYLGITGFGSGTPLNDWQAILWVLPWFTIIGAAIVISIKLCDIAKSDEDANEQKAREKVFTEARLKLYDTERARDDWRKDRLLHNFVRDVVDGLIPSNQVVEFYNELNAENKLRFDDLEVKYRTYRKNFIKK
jgi:hypothetical protein